MDKHQFFPGMPGMQGGQPGFPGDRGGGGFFMEHVGRHGGGGWPGGLGWTIFAILVALLVVALLRLVLDLWHRNRPAGAVAVLDARYARGELDRDAWAKARADLGADAPTAAMPAPRRPRGATT